MRIHEVELYADSAALDTLTVVTAAPQTSSEWFAKYIAEKHNGHLLKLEPASITTQIGQANIGPTSTVVITNLELPVLCGASSADQTAQAVLDLVDKYEHVVVCITLSEALTDKHFDTGRQLARLAVSILHEAQLILQFQPLPTGRARDITGRLVVARGPSTSRPVLQRELFYHVQKTVELKECI